MKKLFSFAVVSFFLFLPFVVSAQSQAAPAANRVALTCLKYSNETLCYPTGWTENPSMKATPGQQMSWEDFFLNKRHLDIKDGAQDKGWAAIRVHNLSYSKFKKKAWQTDPIADREYMGPCGGESEKHSCHKLLGKKKVNEFTAYYYDIKDGEFKWGRTMFVYLVKWPYIYRFEFTAHASEFRKYENYFYAALGSLRLHKK